MRLCCTEIDLMRTHQDEKPLLGSQNSSLNCREHLNLSFKICRVLLIGIGTLIFNQCNMGSSPIPGTKCGCGVMVATLDSESSDRKVIWVRVPSSTQKSSLTYWTHLELWQTWCMRWTENPEKVVRLHPAPPRFGKRFLH